MFTSVGEVKNQALVNPFAKRTSDWYYPESKEEPVSWNQYLTLRSSEEAESTLNGTTSSLNVQRKAYLLIKRKVV
ncbi:hypothetical protein POKO110462_12960 [Pontibacter korlensis]|uniref:Uncharacterized protein n=1 Tax=Pontibacter korlensis TaxID=400092 RepID=A0A0E3ZHD7_9BACT|nr:hypothetical protein [Pontibacter korlensis]AKD04030.1 hypothetical protein PKOR_14165 [Pontibacter korlensis]